MRQSLLFTAAWLRRHWLAVLLGLALTSSLLLALLMPVDDLILAGLQSGNRVEREALKDIARQVSYYGDFLGLNLGLFFVLLFAGWLRRSLRLQRLAVASLICASLAGASATMLRSVVGRPRPYNPAADHFYGPSRSSAFQSLPSGHTATAFGAALPLLLVAPELGIPTLLLAAAVAWSRLQLLRHHPTDALISVAIACLFALPLAQWTKLVVRQPR